MQNSNKNLTDEQIDEIIVYIGGLQEQINDILISELCKIYGLAESSGITNRDELRQYLQSSINQKAVENNIARLNKNIISTSRKLIRGVAESVYNQAQPYYEETESEYTGFNNNTNLQKIVNNITNDVTKNIQNISKSTAFMYRDLANPKIVHPTSLSDMYQKTIDNAIRNMFDSSIDYQQGIRKALENLINDGVVANTNGSIQYESEFYNKTYQRAEVAVKRNIIEGVGNIYQDASNEIGKQFGSNGVEISVHRYPAEDHAPVQGHQFSNEEFDKMQNSSDFEDVQGRKYTGFRRAIGTWNCRHIAIPIVIGVFNPTYTDEQLKDIIDKNNEGYTMSNGRHYTMYECTQIQRNYENNIRKAKYAAREASKANNQDLYEQNKARAVKLTKDYNSFSRQCGIQTKPQNLRIY